MSGSPCQARRRARSKGRQWWTAALCAASFVTGQLVWGEERQVASQKPPGAASDVDQPSGPQTILSEYLHAKAASSSVRSEQQSSLQPATSGRGISGLKPAAIQVAAEVPLVEARPEARSQEAGARGQEPGKTGSNGRGVQGSGFVVQGSGMTTDAARMTTVAQEPKAETRTLKAAVENSRFASAPIQNPKSEIQNLSARPLMAVEPSQPPAREAVATVVEPKPSQPANASTTSAGAIQTNPFVTGTSTSSPPQLMATAQTKPAPPVKPAVQTKPAGQASSMVTSSPPATQREASENLAPIVPAWALPRPAKAAAGGSRESGVGGRESGMTNEEARMTKTEQEQKGESRKPKATNEKAQSASASIQNPKSEIQNTAAAPLRIELGEPRVGSRESGIGSRASGVGGRESQMTKDEAPTTKDQATSTPIQNPKSGHPRERVIQNPAAVRQVDYEARGLLHQQPPRPLALDSDDIEFGKLPEGSPFEAIQESGKVKLRVRRSILLRTKVDIYRTAIVDEAVCDIVQFTPREVSIIGRAVGQTHVTFWFDDPAMAPLTYVVEVKPDAEQVKADESKYQLLENVINEMFPDSKVHLVIVADKLLVKGQAKDSEEAAQIMTIVRAQSGIRGAGGPGGLGGYGGGLSEGAATPVLSLQATGGNPGPAYQIINMLRVPGVQQVALKVKIAELNRSAARGFGVDLNAAIDFGDSVEGSRLFLSSLLNASNTGGTSLLASFSGDDVSVGIRYLQERGVIRLLSEPTLVTLSGRPATFIAGGEFAVPTIVGSVGLNAVTTDFRAFGAIISFLPTVVDKDRVRLQVAPEFSQINSDLAVGGTPGLNVRAATTTVEMREGQTLAIAGLLEDTYKATNVGDLPGLAKIFGRRDTARSETELIILVSPELVHPMEPEEVPPLPGFDVTEPNAGQFFLHGDIEGNPTQDYRSTVWPRLRKRYGMGGPAMTSGPFGHGQ
jgi:pilus assembly protein CpaC